MSTKTKHTPVRLEDLKMSEQELKKFADGCNFLFQGGQHFEQSPRLTQIQERKRETAKTAKAQ